MLRCLLESVAAALGLLVCSPLLLCIAVCIVANDGGSVFYRQERLGRGGRTFSLMNHWNARLMTMAYPPDILVKMPFDAFGAISDYARAEEICEAGRRLMKDALDKYENS